MLWNGSGCLVQDYYKDEIKHGNLCHSLGIFCNLAEVKLFIYCLFFSENIQFALKKKNNVQIYFLGKIRKFCWHFYTACWALKKANLELELCIDSLCFSKPVRLKAPITTAADDILIFYYFSEKTGLDFSCESSAQQKIHMKSQDLFFGADDSHEKSRHVFSEK